MLAALLSLSNTDYQNFEIFVSVKSSMDYLVANNDISVGTDEDISNYQDIINNLI